MAYVQGFVVPVPTEKREAYRAMAAAVAPMFHEYGATRLVEAWGDAVPEGKVTDFNMAVKAKPDESIVFSWIEWPDKATCEAAQKKMETDERMKPDGAMPFDGKRMIYGGFIPLLDTKALLDAKD
jgi:uncharacterized protein YbaA (DUF1428 family)